MNKRQIVREVFLILAGAIVVLTLLGLAYGVAVDINPKAFLAEPSGPSTGERFARPTIVPPCPPGVRCEAHPSPARVSAAERRPSA